MLLFARMAQQRSHWVEQTLRVQISLENLAADIRAAENSERAYLLTGESRFLTAYRAHERSARQEASSLAAMTADNPRQRDNLSRIQPLLNARFSFLQSLISTYKAHGLDAASTRTAIDQQRSLVGSIEEILNAMHLEEQRLLNAREAALARARKRFYWTFSIGYGLMILIVASLYLGVRQYSLQSAAAEAQLSLLNKELEERVCERTALLKAREALLNTFVQHVPAAVAMFDRDLRYLQVSERWCTEYGLSRARILGALHYEVSPDIPAHWREIHRRCLDGETLRAEEDPWIREDGHLVWLRWEIRPWGLANGQPEGILIFSEDITARKHIEESLRESEATIRTLLDTATQAILAVDSSGAIVLANRMVGEMFGYRPEELPGKPLELLIPESLSVRNGVHREAIGTSPETPAMGIGPHLVGRRRNGSDFPIEASFSRLETKRGPLAVIFISDITSRKKAESELRESEHKLRSLAASLLSAHEDERRNLARELHDDVTQSLAFLSIELGRLAKQGPNGSPERTRLEALQQQTQRVSFEVRRLSHGLHPAVITDFGLSVALEEFCEEFEKGREIRVRFDGPVDDSQLNDLGATCLYRVAQESLRNAVVHGNATEIRVALQIMENRILLTVQDNGTGFSADPFRSRTGLGIASMKERIRLVNGSLSIESLPDHGCLVTAAVPMMGVEYAKSENPAGG